ncbi:MAG: hypothetical protein GF364_09335 [Candidatus Lokiarchaeota archaeon]|nr:hypothetical protein [Candidatus Lokiarchaeota archaeon]
MSYIPKYILKRMFPKNKCLKVVKKDGKNYIWVQMVNVLSPITVPDKIDIGDFDINTAPDYIDLKINGTDMPVTVEDVKKYVTIWTQGEGYSYDDILEKNKAAGVTIPVGGKLTLLIDMDYPGAKDAVTGPGEYEVAVDVSIDSPMSVKVKANLKDYEVDFDPSDT